MKKFILIIGMVLAVYLTAFCQQMEDVLYLKSGQVVRGQILEQTPDYVRIAIIGKYKFIYPASDIEKITKEVATTTYESRPYTSTPSALSNGTINPDKKSGSKSGYLGLIQVGVAGPLTEYSFGFYKADLINGYRFSPHFSMGVGIGVRHLSDEVFQDLGDGFDYSIYYMEEQTIFPVFLDLRFNFIKRKVTPYLGLQGGYKFPGLMGNATVGAKINLGNTSALHIGVGIEVMELQFYEFGSFSDYDYFEPTTGLSINLGFSF
jgi:hypothetical protein